MKLKIYTKTSSTLLIWTLISGLAMIGLGIYIAFQDVPNKYVVLGLGIVFVILSLVSYKNRHKMSEEIITCEKYEEVQ